MGGHTLKAFGMSFRNIDRTLTNYFHIMLRWTLTFLIVAIIAAVLGFGGIAAGAAGIAKIFFFIFLVLFILSLVRGART